MRARPFTIARKLPYYVGSLWALARIATISSLVRCVATSNKRLRFRDGRTLALSTTIDLLVVKETLVDDVYGLSSLEADDGLIVDVGAGIGDFALAAATRFPHVTVHAFEPNPRSFRLLERNVRHYGCGNLHAERRAIGTDSTYVLHGLSRGPRATAAIQSDDDHVFVEGVELDRAVPDGRVCLLKVDCEGLELEVLRGATGVLGRTDRVAVEYHRHLVPDADRLLVELLTSFGFHASVRQDPYDCMLGYVHALRV